MSVIGAIVSSFFVRKDLRRDAAAISNSASFVHKLSDDIFDQTASVLYCSPHLLLNVFA